MERLKQIQSKEEEILAKQVLLILAYDTNELDKRG